MSIKASQQAPNAKRRATAGKDVTYSQKEQATDTRVGAAARDVPEYRTKKEQTANTIARQKARSVPEYRQRAR